MDDFGVVEHQQRLRGEEFWNVAEEAFADDSVLVDEQFGLVAPLQGELGDAFVGQRVVEVGYLNVLGAIHWQWISFALGEKGLCTTG